MYSPRISTPPALLPRLRRSQACDLKPGKPSHPPILDTPTGYSERAPVRRFRRSEALSSTWWQVKDSNLRSFRDGFTVPRLRPAETPDLQQLPCVFPRNNRRQSGPTGRSHALLGPPSWVPPNYDNGMPAAPSPSTFWASGSHWRTMRHPQSHRRDSSLRVRIPGTYQPPTYACPLSRVRLRCGRRSARHLSTAVRQRCSRPRANSSQPSRTNSHQPQAAVMA
jgi:hypothetical protein